MSILNIVLELIFIFILLFAVWILADLIVSVINFEKKILKYNNLMKENFQLLGEIALKLKGNQND